VRDVVNPAMELGVFRLGEAAHDVGPVLERCNERVTRKRREFREERDAYLVAVQHEVVVALARDDRADEATAVGRVGARTALVRLAVERDLRVRHDPI